MPIDPVLGIDPAALNTNWEQIPLGTQALNLDELNAQGRPRDWLYPDKIIPTLTRMQSRDRTKDGTTQDTSTDGKRNLNVNIAAADIPVGGGGASPTKYAVIDVVNSASNPRDVDISGCTTIFGAAFGMGGYSNPFPSDPFCAVLSLDDGTNINPATLLQVGGYNGGATDGAGSIPAYGGGAGSIVFPGGWDVKWLFGGAGPNQLVIRFVFSEPDKWQGNATLWYT